MDNHASSQRANAYARRLMAQLTELKSLERRSKAAYRNTAQAIDDFYGICRAEGISVDSPQRIVAELAGVPVETREVRR